jgi:hypothetical protein
VSLMLLQTVLATIALSGGIDRGDRLAADFAKLINEACLPYASGRKTESEVVSALGYRRILSWTYPDPSPPGRRYRRGYSGPIVDFDRGRCIIHLNGEPPKALPRAVADILATHFGSDVTERTVSSALPEKVFCASNMAVSYYSDADILLFGRRARPGFTVKFGRADCAGLAAAGASRLRQ